MSGQSADVSSVVSYAGTDTEEAKIVSPTISPEPLRYLRDVLATREEPRCAAMPEGVEADPRHPCCRTCRVQRPLAQVRVAEPRARPCGEQRGVRVAPLRDRPQGPGQVRGQREVASAVARLEARHRSRVGLTSHEQHRRRAEGDVSDVEPDGLGHPKPGDGQQVEGPKQSPASKQPGRSAALPSPGWRGSTEATSTVPRPRSVGGSPASRAVARALAPQRCSVRSCRRYAT